MSESANQITESTTVAKLQVQPIKAQQGKLNARHKDHQNKMRRSRWRQNKKTTGNRI